MLGRLGVAGLVALLAVCVASAMAEISPPRVVPRELAFTECTNSVDGATVEAIRADVLDYARTELGVDASPRIKTTEFPGARAVTTDFGNDEIIIACRLFEEALARDEPRFIIAHEIAHYILRHPNQIAEGSQDAVCLLAPYVSRRCREDRYNDIRLNAEGRLELEADAWTVRYFRARGYDLETIACHAARSEHLASQSAVQACGASTANYCGFVLDREAGREFERRQRVRLPGPASQCARACYDLSLNRSRVERLSATQRCGRDINY